MLVLVGRELCLFLHVDASAVAHKQRAGFVSLEVRRAAPFMDPKHDTVWFGDHAAVWYWSHERVQQLLGVSSTPVRLRAEATYRGAPVDADDVELLGLEVVPAEGEAYRAGVDARLWRQGQLVSSRWWAQPPSATDLQSFLRGGGLDPSRFQELQVREVGMREQPLSGGLQPRALTAQLRTQSPLIAACVGAMALALLVWQLAGIWRVSSEIRDVTQRTTPLEAQLDTIIDARARTDAASVDINALLALRPPASQTRLLGEIATITPGTDWKLMIWQQSGPETLEVTLKGDQLDASAMVTAWEQSPLLQEVTPATGSKTDELTLQAHLTPLQEQAP